MKYREYLPSNHLKDIVNNYWRFDVLDHGTVSFPMLHETLPDSDVSIVLINQPHFKGVRLLAPHTKKFQQKVLPDSTYFGVRLHPWLSFEPAFIDKKSALNGTLECPEVILMQLGSIELLISTPSELLITQLEKGLTTLFELDVRAVQHSLIKYICLELSEGKAIGEIIATVPASMRVIQKKFKETVGMTMRQYSTVVRQRNLWTDLIVNKKEKSDLIFEHNFYDQAHFINDFKKKMNRSHADFEKYLEQIDNSII